MREIWVILDIARDELVTGGAEGRVIEVPWVGCTAVSVCITRVFGSRVSAWSKVGYVRGISAAGSGAVRGGSSWGQLLVVGGGPPFVVVRGVGEMVREGVIDGVADARSDGVTVVSRDGTIFIFKLFYCHMRGWKKVW